MGDICFQSFVITKLHEYSCVCLCMHMQIQDKLRRVKSLAQRFMYTQQLSNTFSPAIQFIISTAEHDSACFLTSLLVHSQECLLTRDSLSCSVGQLCLLAMSDIDHHFICLKSISRFSLFLTFAYHSTEFIFCY